jgi:hypothetical protein
MQQVDGGYVVPLGAFDLRIECGLHAAEAQLREQGTQLINHRRRS